ncbi:MAG: TrkA family potassium uptake protein [Bacteroidales bacterium]|nr:TrkA family potassium uptake protein [Bacteroidales bacterium]
MKYLIIGLGNYGRVLAEELSALGHEVIGVDNNEHNINALKDKIAVSYLIDATQEMSLSVLPLNAVDVVIVSIGENLDASIRIIALLKKKKVEHLYARAIDSTHKAILEAFDVEKILTPEEDAARNIAHLVDFGTEVDSLSLGDHFHVMRFKVPKKLFGFYIKDLELEKKFHLNVIALRHSIIDKNSLGMITKQFQTLSNELINSEKLADGDELVCFGAYKDFQALWKAL